MLTHRNVGGCCAAAVLLLVIAPPTTRAQADGFGFDLWARPPRGLDVADLGAIYDSSFRRVSPPERAVLRVRANGERRTGAGLRVLDGPMELAAHHEVWPVAASSEPMAVSVYRAYEIERTFELEEPPQRSSFPREGGWYVSAVALGRMLEVVIPQRRVSSGDAGRPLVFWRDDVRNGQRAFVSLIGLRPRVPGGRPPLVERFDDLSPMFRAVGGPRPIFVRYRWLGPDRDDLPLVATVTVEGLTAPPLRAITRTDACRWREDGVIHGAGEPWDPHDGPDLVFVVLDGPRGHRGRFFSVASANINAGIRSSIERWTFGGWPGEYALQLQDFDSVYGGDLDGRGCRTAANAADRGSNEVVGHWEFIPRETVIHTMSRSDHRLVLTDPDSGATVSLVIEPWRP